MSSYTASSATISPSAIILQRIAASGSTFFDLSCPVASSLQLTHQRNLLQAADSLAGVNAGWDSLSAVPGALDALRQAAPAQLAAFTSLQSQASRASLTGGAADALRREATSQLTAALDTTVGRLRSDERKITVAALQAALTNLDYTVRPLAVGDRITGIAAYRDNHVIAAAVADGGTVEIDTAGLSGDSCAAPLNALGDALSDLGVEMRIERRTDHGDRNGGTLIRRAGAADTGDLAAGIVASAEQASGRPAGDRRPVRNRPIQNIGGTA